MTHKSTHLPSGLLALATILLCGFFTLLPHQARAEKEADATGVVDATYDIHAIGCAIIGVPCTSQEQAGDQRTDRWSAWRDRDVVAMSTIQKSRDQVVSAREEEEKAYLRSIGLEAPSQYGKAIVISLSRQTLYGFEHGQLVNSFYISSGVAKYPSPIGSFAIYSKFSVQRMRGTYADAPWDNYDIPNVPWISYFTGSYAIHSAPWHNNFGRPMSHGCINAATANAYWVYSWAPIGTPVIVRW